MPILTETETGYPFSESSNAYTRDLLYDKITNKQFIAIETRSGDIFYMVIDYDKPLDEDGERYETYFLNLVDSRDLLDIVDSSEIQEEPEVIYVTPEPTVEPTATPVAVTEETPTNDNRGSAMLGLFGILLAAAGGALWYFKFRKPGGGKGSPRMDDYGYDDEEDETEEPEENEDE
jgi:hypothetical protein